MNLLALQADGLEIAYIAVGILLGIAVVGALIAQIVVIVGYWRGNRTQNSLGISGGEFARKLLDEDGLQEVQVKKCTLLRTLLFGNHYSIARKTVFLRIMTINKASVTSVAIAAQKVALAEQHRDGNKKMIVRGRLQGLGVFAPSLFLPLVIVGILMDLFVFENLFMTVIVLILGILFVIFAFVVTILNIPVEKSAMQRASEMLGAYLTAEEMNMVKKVYRSYLIEYVMQFIVALLRLIQLILKAILAVRKNR